MPFSVKVLCVFLTLYICVCVCAYVRERERGGRIHHPSGTRSLKG